VVVDQLIGEGSHVQPGAVDMLTTHLTPGHTKGCTSWSMQGALEGDRPAEVLFACSLTVAGQPWCRGHGYPNAAAATSARPTPGCGGCRQMCSWDFHPGAFDFDAKRAKLAAGDGFAFVDKSELARRVDAAEKNFESELAAQRKAKGLK
jgi:metallo-beta-lactamase class B